MTLTAELTHLDGAGAARMVNVGDKQVAVAAGAVVAGDLPKADVLAVARIAGIMAARRTGELIPLCHPLGLDGVTVAALSVYDMCKAVDKEMSITDVRPVEKTGGRSGRYRRVE